MGLLSPVHCNNDAQMIQRLYLGCSSNLNNLKTSIQYNLDDAGALCRAETTAAVALGAVGATNLQMLPA